MNLIYVRNPEINVKNGILHFMDIFHCRILFVGLEKDLALTPEAIREVFTELNVEQMHIVDHAAQHYLQILSVCNTINKVVLCIPGNLHDGAIYVIEEKTNSMKMITIFKMDDTPNCNNLHIELDGRASKNGLNVFLKSWIKGPNGKLKSIRAYFWSDEEDYVQEVFDGIDSIPTEGAAPPDIEAKEICNGYGIKSEEGTEATLYFSLNTEVVDGKIHFQGDVFILFHV